MRVGVTAVGKFPCTILALQVKLEGDAAVRWHYFGDTNLSGQELTGINPFTGNPNNLPGVSGATNNDPEKYLLGMDGHILSVTPVETVMTSRGTASGQFSCTLFDGADLFAKGPAINNARCRYYQWSIGTPLANSVLIFDGRVNTPYTYEVASKKVSFTVVSLIEDKQVGFSVDEGDFDYIPPRIVGRNWPIVFGTAYKVPALQLLDVQRAVAADSYVNDQAVSTPSSIDSGAMYGNLRSMQQAQQHAFDCFNRSTQLRLDAQAAITNSDPAMYAYFWTPNNSNDPFAPGTGAFGNLQEPQESNGITRSNQLNQEADRMTEQGNEYLREAQRAGEASRQSAGGGGGSSNVIPLANSSALPQNTKLSFTDNQGQSISGTVSGNNLIIDTVGLASAAVAAASRLALEKRELATSYDQDVQSPGLFIIPGGTPLSLSAGYPVEYIACQLHCAVLGVWAKRRVGEGESVMWPVPASYYNAQNVTYGTVPPGMAGLGLSATHITAVKITMSIPLSSRVNGAGQSEGWEGDAIYCDLRGPRGPHVCDVIEYLIATYTLGAADPASFNLVRPLLNAYPVNFAVLERRNVLDLISDIAYQSRCAVFIKDDHFYIKYLSSSAPVVDTISTNDMEAGSEVIDYTPSSDALVTQLIVTYNQDYGGERAGGNSGFRKSFKLNASRFGIRTQEDTYFIYNDPALVQKSAIFWLQRLANQYKRIRFNTFLHKLHLEMYDYVHIYHPAIADVSVIAMVESAVFDSSTNKITMTLLTPVRAGERKAHPFYMPANLPPTTIYGLSALYAPVPGGIQPGDSREDVGSGTKISGNVLGKGPAYYNLSPSRAYQDSGTNADRHGNLTPPSQNFGVSDGGNVAPGQPTFLTPGSINSSLPPQQGTRRVKSIQIKPLQDVAYTPDIPGCFPGIIVDGGGDDYTVEVYCFGRDKPPAIVHARPFRVLEGDTVQPMTAVMVFKIVQSDRSLLFEFQPSTWSGPSS